MKLIAEKLEERCFNEIKNVWNRLLVESQSNNIFLTWEWIYCWWHAFCEDKELCIIVVKQNSEIVGIAPFYIEKTQKIIKLKTIQICSSTDLFPDYLDVIVKVGYEKMVKKAVLDYLLNNRIKWDFAIFDNVLLNSNLINYFCNCKKNVIVRKESSSLNPYIKIKGNYTKYIENNFKRKKRYNIKREKRIALEKKGLKLYQVAQFGEICKSINHLFDLHKKRANQKNIKSTIVTENVYKFLQLFSAEAIKNNWLALFFLMKSSVPICTMYCLTYNRKMLFYQSGFDPNWSNFSVGSVLLQIIIEKTFNKQLEEFDFLKGDEEYKKTWANRERTQYRIVVYRKTFTGILKYLNDNTKTFIKKVVKKYFTKRFRNQKETKFCR